MQLSFFENDKPKSKLVELLQVLNSAESNGFLKLEKLSKAVKLSEKDIKYKLEHRSTTDIRFGAKPPSQISKMTSYIRKRCTNNRP